MLAEYRQATAEATGLKAYNDQLATQVKSQQDELLTMTRQVSEIETTSREALPMMQKMVATLGQFVKLDIPFLPDERTNRIAQLEDMMTRADVSVSEKYRRIVEAYQIEIEYGRTIEAYQGKVGEKTVDFLRALYLAAPEFARTDFATVAATRIDTLRAPGWTEDDKRALVAALARLRKDASSPAHVEHIKSAGVLRVGTTGDYAPFSLEQEGVRHRTPII